MSNPIIVVEDISTHPQLGWVAKILSHAKELRAKGSVNPMLFYKVGDSTLEIVALSQLGFDGDESKETAAFWMRRLLRERGATTSVFLTDSYVTDLAGMSKEESSEAIGKYGNVSNWPAALRSRVKRREALNLAVEEGEGFWMLTQFYRRAKGVVTFEECQIIEYAEDAKISGRFARLLPKRNA
jgi:hypothetical protein